MRRCRTVHGWAEQLPAQWLWGPLNLRLSYWVAHRLARLPCWTTSTGTGLSSCHLGWAFCRKEARIESVFEKPAPLSSPLPSICIPRSCPCPFSLSPPTFPTEACSENEWSWIQSKEIKKAKKLSPGKLGGGWEWKEFSLYTQTWTVIIFPPIA